MYSARMHYRMQGHSRLSLPASTIGEGADKSNVFVCSRQVVDARFDTDPSHVVYSKRN